MPIFDIFVANPSRAAARRPLMEPRNRTARSVLPLGFRTLTKSYRSAHDLNGEDIKVPLNPRAARGSQDNQRRRAGDQDRDRMRGGGAGSAARGVPPLTA